MPTSSGTATTPVPLSPASESPRSGDDSRSRSEVSHHQVLASASRMAVLDLLRSRAQPLGVGEVAQHIGLHQNTVRSHLDLLVDAGYVVRRTEAPTGPGRPRVVYEATAAPDGERNYRLLAEVLAQHLMATSERPGEAAVNAGRAWAALTDRSQHRAPSDHGDVDPATPGDDTASPGGGNPANHGGGDLTPSGGGELANHGGGDLTAPGGGDLTEPGHDGPPAVAPGLADAPAISAEAAIAAVVRMLGDIGFAPEVSADRTAIHLHRCPFRELAERHPDVVCGAHLGMLQGALDELGAPVSATRLLPFVQPDLCIVTLTRSAAAAGRVGPAS